MSSPTWGVLHSVGVLLHGLGGVLVSHPTPAQPQAVAPGCQVAPGTCRVAVTGATVSLAAQGASVAAIMAARGRQAGIVRHLPRLADDPITLHFGMMRSITSRGATTAVASMRILVPTHTKKSPRLLHFVSVFP
jgi:hypothetical protein